MQPRAHRRHGLLPGLALFCLAACSSAPDDPGAVTPSEQRQLNEAAAQLDANGLTPPTTNESTQP